MTAEIFQDQIKHMGYEQGSNQLPFYLQSNRLRSPAGRLTASSCRRLSTNKKSVISSNILRRYMVIRDNSLSEQCPETGKIIIKTSHVKKLFPFIVHYTSIKSSYFSFDLKVNSSCKIGVHFVIYIF